MGKQARCRTLGLLFVRLCVSHHTASLHKPLRTHTNGADFIFLADRSLAFYFEFTDYVLKSRWGPLKVFVSVKGDLIVNLEGWFLVFG